MKQALAIFLERQWVHLSAWQLLLLPLAALFALLSGARRWLYRAGVLRAQRLPAPVVVVGNISVGGTGKTPLTLWLAQTLRAQGLYPCIISRGYGAATTAPREVDRSSKPEQVGDEAVLLALRSECPVWVGADRVATGHALMQAHPECDVVLCDDGLQHYALARDFEIAVVDGARGFGNGLLLPAGPLREPRARLAEVDAVVVNGPQQVKLDAAVRTFAMQLTGDTLHDLRTMAAIPLAAWRGRRVHAVAGIGHPQRFFDDLRAAGLDVIAHAFPDHHPYTADELQFGDDLPVVMTEKDAVKCHRFAQPHWYLRPVRAQLDPALLQFMLDRIRRRDGSKIA